nr:hypothetical protein [Tanacetum cinerariifolium]
MGRDRAKKKSSLSGARSETSIAGDPILVNALLKRELELEDQKCREQGELKRLKIAQRDKKLDLKKCSNFNNNKNGRTTSRREPKEADAALKANILDFCEEHYEDILPVIMDKICRDKRKEVHTRLDFEENPERAEERERAHKTQALGPCPQGTSAFDRLSNTYSPSTTNSGLDEGNSRDRSHSRGRSRKQGSSSRDRPRDRNRPCGIEESYSNTLSSYRAGDRHGYHARDKDHFRNMKRGRENESSLSRVSKSGTGDGGHWKTRTKRRKPADEEELSVPWTCEDVDPGARFWFNELPPESIDGYKGLKAAFLAYFMQQKKYVKYPVEIHNIKQMDREPLKKMMTINTAFIREETAAASKKKVHTLWKSQDQSKRQTSKWRSDFRNQPKDGRGSNKFTPLTRTHKEIFVAESGKFKPPPPMVTLVEKRSRIKFCEFQNDKGHNTDECVQLRKQIEELVRAGKLSHFIKEIRPWQRVMRQKVTQSFAHVKEITFPPLTTNKGTRGPLVIEAKIYGHVVHRIYVDGGSSMEGSYMAARTVKALGNYRGRIAIYKSMDEFYDSEVTITVQRYHWKACDKRDPSSTIHGSRNAQFPTEKRRHASKRAKAIQVEVQKLVEAEILREVYYHYWLSNLVMVKKHNGSWRIRLQRLSSNTDAEQDEEKTAFHTSHGVYSYTKMPFSLKNTGATYQRDRAFDRQIGQNLEIYVDELVIKSHTETELLRDIKETFRTLRKINMKLNPKKWEHNITYWSRTYVKGQILADFLVEKSDDAPPKASVIETPQEPWTLFMDGSSCVDGSGVGLILTSLEGTEFTYALRFQFTASNNEAEYEALIAGLRIAPQLEVQNVHLSVDSKLVENQVLGTYVAKEENMIKYLENTKSLISGFTNFSISQVPRSKNKKADELIEEEEPTWMTSIIKYLRDETILKNQKEVSKLHIKARQYDILKGILYRRSFLKPWLRCIRPLQADYIIWDIHKGSCSMHAGPGSVVAKAMRSGAKTSSITADSHHGPVAILQIGIDIAGPFPKGPGKVKFLIVTIDYFTKGIEEKVVAIISDSQPNGLIERENRNLGKGIKACLGERNKNWLEELPYVFWAHRTMIKSSNNDTSFSLTYGRKAIIPAEIEMPTYRTAVLDAVYNDEELRLNLDLLEERHERTLGPKWEGPYEVTEALGYGVYKLRSTNGTVLQRTWNITNLKKCYL